MTACSNHPGTPAGLALAELLAGSEQLGAAVREREQAWCAALGLERDDWRVLRLLAGSGLDQAELAERLQMPRAELAARLARLGAAGRVERATGGHPGWRPSARGQLDLAHLDRERFAWVDAVAAELAAADLRTAGELLARLARRLAAGGD